METKRAALFSGDTKAAGELGIGNEVGKNENKRRRRNGK
jgi:hypothetical protein